MKNRYKKDIDFSQVDLTKVPLKDLDYYAKNSTLRQIVSAICTLMKKLGVIKDEDDKQETRDSLNKVSNAYVDKTKNQKNFCVGKFVDEQDLHLTDKIILNHKLNNLENQRVYASKENFDLSNEFVEDNVNSIND